MKAFAMRKSPMSGLNHDISENDTILAEIILGRKIRCIILKIKIPADLTGCRNFLWFRYALSDILTRLPGWIFPVRALWEKEYCFPGEYADADPLQIP